MTNKVLISLLLIVGSIGGLYAQDFIVLKTGKEIKAKVVELNPTEIRYKEFQNPNSSTIIMDKKYVFMVRYENGINEVVNAITDQPIKTETASPSEGALWTKEPSQALPTTKAPETNTRSSQNPPQEEIVMPTVRNTPKTEVAAPPVQSTPKVEGSNSSAQNAQKPILTDNNGENEGFTAGIFVGAAMPLTSYASADFENTDKASGAKLGFCTGLQVGYRTRHKVSVLFEGQYTRNPYEIKLEDVRNIYTLRGDWQHIAALVGARSEMSLSSDVSLYALTLGGFSFASVSGDFAEVLELLDTKTSTKSFAYSFGVGLILKKHFTIGIRTINSSPVFGDFKQSTYNAQATIGFQF